MSELDLQRRASPSGRQPKNSNSMACGSPPRSCCCCCRRSSRSGGALTTFSLIGISIIFSLSYNILLGQTGMLSFGHAVYYGLGGFLVIHAINIIGANKLPIPLPLVPLIGGLTGLVFAMLLGWVSTQRSGTAFAMISLGVAELIASSALILRTFFGGEAGISANRTKLLRVFDWNFGPQIQIYYLVAAWTLICGHRHVRAHPHAARAHVQRRARQSGARAVRRLRPARGALSRLLLFRLLRRHRGRARRHQFRDRQLRLSRRRAIRNRAVRRPISAASVSSSARSSARSSSPCCRSASAT